MANLGGTDQAPDPHELLEAALVACTVITVQMYADRHQLSLKSSHVKVKVESEGAETLISRHIELSGELIDEQRSKLVDIANKCPIHRLLQSKIKIQTTSDLV